MAGRIRMCVSPIPWLSPPEPVPPWKAERLHWERQQRHLNAARDLMTELQTDPCKASEGYSPRQQNKTRQKVFSGSFDRVKTKSRSPVMLL